MEISTRQEKTGLSGGKMIISLLIATIIIFCVFQEDKRIWEAKPNERVLEINNSEICIWDGICIISGEPYKAKNIEGNRIVFEKFKPEGVGVCCAFLILILSAVIYAVLTLPSYERVED